MTVSNRGGDDGGVTVLATQTERGYRSLAYLNCGQISAPGVTTEHTHTCTHTHTHMHEMATWRKIPLPDLLTLLYIRC